MGPSEGGGFYYTCDGKTSCKVDMTENTFIENTSEESGGGIKWVDVEPVNIEDSSNTFKGNSAGIYGDDIACFS